MPITVQNGLMLCGVIFLVISTAIYLPLCAYGIYRYYTYRNHIIMKKHYSDISLYMVGTSFCIMSISVLVGAIMSKVIPHHIGAIIQPYFGIPGLIFSSWNTTTFLWRSFMNYYSIKYSNAIDSDKWKQLIDDKYILNNNSNNWFIENKYKYGNHRYWYKHWIIFNIVIATIIIGLRIIFSSDSEEIVKLRWLTIVGATSLIVIIVVVVVGIVYCKTPSYGDIFFINVEMKILIWIWIIAFIVFTCLGGGSVALIHEEHGKAIVRIFMLLLLQSCYCFGVLSQTLYMIHKNKVWLIKNDTLLENHVMHGGHDPKTSTELRKITSLSLSNALSVDSQNEIHSMNSSEYGGNITIHDVLSDSHGFDSFFFHLNKEFSPEILLCMLEGTQFKEKIVRIYRKICDADDPDDWDPFIHLNYDSNSKRIPRSQIVEGSIDLRFQYLLNDIIYDDKKPNTDLAIRAYCLYEKYVAPSSEFEINIPYDMRIDLVDYMQHIDEWIGNKKFKNEDQKIILTFLFGLFDDILREMSKLLKASFRRYQKSVSYVEWLKLWKPRSPKQIQIRKY